MDMENLPPALKAKYNPDGSPQPFAGNTVICHIPQDSILFGELLAIHAAMQHQSYSAKLSLLPPDSYHMTVFGGLCDRLRQVWADGLDIGIPTEDADAEIERRLGRLYFDQPCRFQMRLSPTGLVGPAETLRLEVMAATEDENRRIRALRDRLSEASGIHAPSHDTYDFHISLAYAIDWLSPEEHADMTRSYAEWRDRIISTVPVFELGPLEYCVFADMLYFDRRMWIGQPAKANA